MKSSMSILTKIWLSLSILILGYLGSTVYGIFIGVQTEKRLNNVSKCLLPLVRQSQIGVLDFNEQIKQYENAVMLGEEIFIETARLKAISCQNSLTDIIKTGCLTQEKQLELIELIKNLKEFSKNAQSGYISIVRAFRETDAESLEEVSQLKEQASVLFDQTKFLKNQLNTISDEFVNSLNSELEDIVTSTRQQIYSNAVIFIWVVVIGLTLISLIISKSIVRPLKKTFMLENAVEQSIDGIMVHDLAGNIKFVNHAWAKMHGYEPYDLQTSNISCFYGDEDFKSLIVPFNDKVKTKGASAGEILHKTKGGEKFPTLMTANLLQDKKGNSINIVSIARDITDLKLKERELREAKENAETANQALHESMALLKKTQNHLVQSEKMVALGDLVAGVAHEINTPVGVSVTAASYLEEKTNEIKAAYESGELKRSNLEKYVSSAKEASAIILKNLDRAANLIRSFKQVAVDQSGEEQRPFNMKAYIDDLLLSLRPKFKRTKHRIEVECPDYIEMNSYPGAFSQILTNFLMNSLTHGFKDIEEGSISIKAFTENETFNLIYSDNGIGVAPENLKKIFDPFFTTKRGQGGTGLGLHIVYNLVTQKLGGTINCQSEQGKGISFNISLPMLKNIESE
ncbi:MAG: PAS domain S-box protein [Desulfobacterales bacterium]|nr:PAS domain S-box protein [Desulfobacterales bacterium]